jgi:hypothetical protein
MRHHIHIFNIKHLTPHCDHTPHPYHNVEIKKHEKMQGEQEQGTRMMQQQTTAAMCNDVMTVHVHMFLREG